MSNTKLKEVLAKWGRDGDGKVMQGERLIAEAAQCPVLGEDEGGFALKVGGIDPATYLAIPDQFKVEVADHVVKLGSSSTKWVVLRKCVVCGKPFPLANSDLQHTAGCRGCRASLKSKAVRKPKTEEETAALIAANEDLRVQLAALKAAQAEAVVEIE